MDNGLRLQARSGASGHPARYRVGSAHNRLDQWAPVRSMWPSASPWAA